MRYYSMFAVFFIIVICMGAHAVASCLTIFIAFINTYELIFLAINDRRPVKENQILYKRTSNFSLA